MDFNKHSNLIGQHAFLSASKYHWINYDEEKILKSFSKFRAAQLGTKLHEFAKMAIELGIPLKTNHNTLNMYVNDAIGFKMKPEQILFYSYNCFGTVDTISFKEKNNFLRIHDLKTGEEPASMHQLEVYEALFCLEYKIDPRDIQSELRIYQLGEVIKYTPDPEFIFQLMNKIIRFDELIEFMKGETA